MFSGDQLLIGFYSSVVAMERAQTWADDLLSYRDEYLLVHSENFTGEKTTRAN